MKSINSTRCPLLPTKMANGRIRQRTRRGTPLWLPRGGVGYAGPITAPDVARYVMNNRGGDENGSIRDPAWCAMLGVLVRLAYPAPHRGSHEGVPLRCGLAYRAMFGGMMDPAYCAMLGAVMRLAYPTPHRGSHKGVPLRVHEHQSGFNPIGPRSPSRPIPPNSQP